jgi:adenosylcobyric acid synthase
VFGTMWHGCLEGDDLRAAWLSEVAELAGMPELRPGRVSFRVCREAQIDALADAVEEHLGLDRVLDLASAGPVPLPVLRGHLD